MGPVKQLSYGSSCSHLDPESHKATVELNLGWTVHAMSVWSSENTLGVSPGPPL